MLPREVILTLPLLITPPDAPAPVPLSNRLRRALGDYPYLLWQAARHRHRYRWALDKGFGAVKRVRVGSYVAWGGHLLKSRASLVDVHFRLRLVRVNTLGFLGSTSLVFG